MDRLWGSEESDTTEKLTLHSQVIAGHWMEFSALYFVCSSVCMSIPISQFIPPFPLGIKYLPLEGN